MNKPLQTRIEFEAVEAAALDGAALVVDLDGYEGPLHILLALARSQKVDLLKLSITKLTDQYLAFVREARSQRFDLAAEYLVMAAWLAYLKSRLLLPKAITTAADERSADEIAAALAFRLAKLDAMRRAADGLAALPTLKRDIFPRGDPQAIRIVSHSRFEGDLYGLMDAYISQRRRERDRTYRPIVSVCYRLDEARDRLRGMLPGLADWQALDDVAPEVKTAGPPRASLVASTFAASLELVREGELEARQMDHFADLFVRARAAA